MSKRRVRRAVSRINVLPLLSDQFRYLRRLSDNKPAVFIRVLVLLVGPFMGVVSWVSRWQMQSVGDLVGALGLLAGVFLSAFAIVFGLRMNYGSKPVKSMDRKTSRLLDETALTLLSAGLLAGLDAVWLAGVSASIPEGWVVSHLATAVTVALSSLVVLYFLMSVRRMHVLYTDTFVPFWRVKRAVEGSTEGQASASHRPEDVDARRQG